MASKKITGMTEALSLENTDLLTGVDLSAAADSDKNVRITKSALGFAADDDPRLSDARVPTAHAGTHEDGGSDELALAAAQITDFQTAVSANTKLAGIEDGATADQTAAEIKTAYESNANTNAFTDAEQTKVSNALTSTGSIDTHTDVDTTTAAPSTGDHLEWSGSSWTPGTPSDDVTLVTTSHDYLSLSGQAITLGAIDLATDVTGNLPAANVAFGTGTDSYVWTSDGAGGAAWEALPGGGWTDGTTITYWGLTSQTPTYSATITIDLDSGQQVVYTMTGNSTITLSSTMTNTQATFILDTGGFTPTWAAAMSVSEPEGGHDWSASTDDVYLVHVVKQGSNWYIAETPMGALA